MPEQYNIRGIIFDLDGVVKHTVDAFCELKEHNNDSSDIRSFPPNDSILYPPGLDESFWTFNEVIDKIGSFLHSIISLNLSVSILSCGNISFLTNLLEFWPSIDKSDFSSLSSIENSSRANCLDQNIILMAENMGVPIGNLMIIGEISFHSKLKLANGVLKLGLVRPKCGTSCQCNFTSDNLSDVLDIVKKGILLDVGKLPNNFLSKLLLEYEFKDPYVIVGPSVGEDTAAIDIARDEVLLLKSDPITFVTDNIGYYSVLINSNDMATSGAMPRWMLTTLIFPPRISIYEIQKIFGELYKTCSNFNISICGGHTEITDAVSRPVVVGTVVGTIECRKLLKKQGIGTGDFILMTKGVAIEGSVVIASEFRELLLKKGMSLDKINDCLELKSEISILDEAKIAWGNSGVTALHDVTEGGILTAISELGKASGYGVDIYLNDIFIYQQTRYLCDLLNINALGLIGSGCLLVCCKKATVNLLINDMNKNNIRAKIIGKISEKDSPLRAYKYGRPCQVPQFEVDEITRLPRPL